MNDNQMNFNETKEMFVYVAEKIIENKLLLTQIDSEIGDGDHGIGMSIGFGESAGKLAGMQSGSINEVFTTIGSSMIKTMGGASGVIFGTLFSGGVRGLPQIEQLDLPILADIMERGLNAVIARGKAQLGDKTMVDALAPAVESLKQSASKDASLIEALELAVAAADAGVENTKGYVAKFGRAKSLGERAVGHQDPGATSVWIILSAMSEWMKKNEMIAR
jgi:dihydroxyacetone kinase phosphoprotein-dependent L subunit